MQLITKREFLDFHEIYKEQWQQAAARRKGGGDFYATQNLRIGRRFAEAVIRATREGSLLYGEAFRLTGLYGKSFDRYAESLRSGKVA